MFYHFLSFPSFPKFLLVVVFLALLTLQQEYFNENYGFKGRRIPLLSVLTQLRNLNCGYQFPFSKYCKMKAYVLNYK
jgi:hypothetical protein